MIAIGIVLFSITVLFINIVAVNYIMRIVFVNKRKITVKGKMVDFDNRHMVTVEYNVNGTNYKEECGVMFVRPLGSDIINGKELISYSFGDEVNVYYDRNNPKRFLIDGASAFYKFRTMLIFFLDIAILFLVAICTYMVHLQEIGILK